MKFNELLIFSFGNLVRRKLRTLLTVLGVIIGTASIVVMMSLGVGFNSAYLKQMEDSSTLTLIRVNNNYVYGAETKIKASGNYSYGADTNNEVVLTSDTIDEFSNIPHVTTSSQVYSFDFIAKSGKYESWMSINAMSYDMLSALDIPIIEGNMPSKGSDLSLICGKEISKGFYIPDSSFYEESSVDLMKDSIYGIFDTEAYYSEGATPKKYPLNVAAVCGSAEEGGWSEYDYSVYADFEAVSENFSKIFKKKAWPGQGTDKNGKPLSPMTFPQAYVLVDDVDNVSDVQKTITDMGFQAYSDLDYVKSMQQTSRNIQYLLGGIGAVSLFVAAIGITNTMMMSIFERTKEIGIFKVIGCPLSTIRAMFLCESGLIGFGGGIFGLGFSYGVSAIINVLTAQSYGGLSVIPLWLAAVGVSVAVLVAMGAGISPALRAAKLSPLEAIRSL